MTEQYNKTILPNGIRLVTERIPTVRSVAFGVWINVGSRRETLANQGISHFLEHMIFKGTEKRSALDIALEIESVGGLINAFTGKELTCFYTQMLDENIGIAIDVLSDITANSLFLEEEVTKEKSVIIEEISNLEDTPDELIHDYFIRELYPDHPLGYPIMGTRETVLSFSPRDLKELIGKRYSADKVVIAAAGNLEHKQLCGMVEDAFSFPKPSEPTPEPGLPALPSGRKLWRRTNNQAHIIIGTRSFSYADDRKYPFFVMNTILGGGMSSRLFQVIREQYGYAYAVYTFNESHIDTGLFGVYIGTDKNRIDDVIGLAISEFDKIMRVKIADDEIDRIKAQLKGNLMLGLESTSSRMYRLAKMEVHLNKFITLDDTINKINQVTAEQVLETANELLTPDNLLSVIFTPSEEKHDNRNTQGN
ncbi:MAG: insulinase family protein [candidate division Zixibacteria bacterium]|nr:insulinase family protein [Candidatus Tariuqbacter arcticus]